MGGGWCGTSCGLTVTCVATVDVGEVGGLLLVGLLNTCCLANIEPAEDGLLLGLVAPGERGGRAEIGDGGTKGNPAKTESAWEDVVFAVLNQGVSGKSNFTWFERELDGLAV